MQRRIKRSFKKPFQGSGWYIGQLKVRVPVKEEVASSGW
jgi:hypothetical protein